jgi:IS1 family transposase
LIPSVNRLRRQFPVNPVFDIFALHKGGPRAEILKIDKDIRVNAFPFVLEQIDVQGDAIGVYQWRLSINRSIVGSLQFGQLTEQNTALNYACYRQYASEEGYSPIRDGGSALTPFIKAHPSILIAAAYVSGLPGWVCIQFLFLFFIKDDSPWLAMASLLLGLSLLFITFLCARTYARILVTQKQLTEQYYCNTLIAIGRANMANILSIDKQVAIISALAEGSGIRQIERITGVHRDTIMRLGVRVGQGCAGLLDRKMRDLSCQRLQFDEIWGFIGKKERHCTVDDDPRIGDAWTFCAIDSDTKLVPSFKVGKRDSVTANAFVRDVASRMRNRVQISSDALKAYVEAIELAFGANVDFAQIVKTYTHDESQTSERKYSAAHFVISEKNSVSGFPNMALASTSHVERLNGTTRLHMRRLTRLTYAFSKKRENFEAAVALHFAYYNFVKRHITLRATPAMAAGIEHDFWTVGDLVEAVA